MNLTCPYCEKLHECHSGADGNPYTPRDGDASLCIDCGCISVFDAAECCLRLPTEAEQHKFDNDIEHALAREAWREMKRNHSH